MFISTHKYRPLRPPPPLSSTPPRESNQSSSSAASMDNINSCCWSTILRNVIIILVATVLISNELMRGPKSTKVSKPRPPQVMLVAAKETSKCRGLGTWIQAKDLGAAVGWRVGGGWFRLLLFLRCFFVVCWLFVCWLPCSVVGQRFVWTRPNSLLSRIPLAFDSNVPCSRNNGGALVRVWGDLGELLHCLGSSVGSWTILGHSQSFGQDEMMVNDGND